MRMGIHEPRLSIRMALELKQQEHIATLCIKLRDCARIAISELVTLHAPADALLEALLEPLCWALGELKCDESRRLALTEIAKWTRAASPETVRLSLPLLATTVPVLLALNLSEDARVAVARLVAVILGRSRDKHAWQETITRLLTDPYPEVVAAILSAEGLEETDAKPLVRCIEHRRARVRLAALAVIDSLIRSSPRQGTYATLCSLIGRCDEIAISEVFEPTVRLNYMSLLSFDRSLAVRQRWFGLLVDWTVSLDDRADVSLHFAPYVLTGLLDPCVNVADSVWSGLNTRIASAYFDESSLSDITFEDRIVSPGAQSYVIAHARRFFKALLHPFTEFQNCSSALIGRLLNLIALVLRDRLVEFLPEVLVACARFSVHSDVAAVVAESVEPAYWWNALQCKGATVNWELTEQILNYSSTVGPEVRSEILQLLGFDQPSNASRVFLALVKDKVSVEEAYVGLSLRMTDITDRLTVLVEVGQIPELIKKVMEGPAPELVLTHFLRLLQSPDPPILESIRKFILSCAVIDEELLSALCTLVSEPSALLGHLLETHEDTTISSIRRLLQQAWEPDEFLIESLSKRTITSNMLACLCALKGRLSHVQITHVLIRLTSILEFDKIDGNLGSSALQFVDSLLMTPTEESVTRKSLDVLVLMFLHSQDNTKLRQTTGDVIRNASRNARPASLTQLTQYASDGFIGRHSVLSQFIH